MAMEAAQDGLYDWNLLNNEIYYSADWKCMLGYGVDELFVVTPLYQFPFM